MSKLSERAVAFFRQRNISGVFDMPVEETDPIPGDDGRLWKRWRHTGDVTAIVLGKRYHAYYKHDMPQAMTTVLRQILADLESVDV